MNEKTTISILVVDDDQRLIGALRRTLTYEVYHISTATSGGETLSLARRRVYDLVILDRLLPDMDGLRVCHRLREEDQYIAVLMLMHGMLLPTEWRGWRSVPMITSSNRLRPKSCWPVSGRYCV